MRDSAICYFSASTREPEPDIVTNYPEDWAAHYTENAYHSLDPVLTQAWNGHRPINWIEVSEQTRQIRNFFGEAQEFGLYKSGMTVPIRDGDNRSAYFSISSDMSKTEWAKTAQRYNLDFRNFAFLFHIYYLQLKKVNDPVRPNLSERELQVLSWAAAGKSAWETSQILGLSQRTVDSYIKNCMVKLSVTNKTHAVALAASYDLLTDL